MLSHVAPHCKSGFSLLQLSVLLAIGAMIMAASLPSGVGDDVAKMRLTLERMQKIEAATQQFMTEHHRRPYPSSIVAGFDSTAYGIELAVPVDYSGTVPTTHFTSAISSLATTTVTAGSKTLTVSSTSGLAVGWLVSGAGIPSDTWISAINSGTTLTMNNTATASGSVTVSFRNPLVAGGVPTKTLGLPDDTGIDGYGRRIVYMVDSRVARGVSRTVTNTASNGGLIRLTLNSTTGLQTGDTITVQNVSGTVAANGVWVATVINGTTVDLQNSTYAGAYTSGGTVTLERNGCMALQNNNLRGALALSNTDTFNTGTYDNVMWALMSYGKDGQGAVGIQGAALTNRIKTKNTDASSLNNAFFNASEVTTYAPSGLVNKATTNTFDDIVWVDHNSKNTCGLGNTVTSFKDFRINGGGTSGTSSAVFGDVNGDGWPDIILGIPQQNVVRVIFGRKDSWPEPNTAYTTTSLDGKNGFTIAKGSLSSGFGARVATGDVNGDGYVDIIACSSGGAIGCGIIFGAAAWPSTYTIGTSIIPTTAHTIGGLYTGYTPDIAVGDVNGDGYDDIALPFNDTIGVTTSSPSPQQDHYGNFDGTDDVVAVAHNAALDFTGTYSISVWLRPNNVSTTYANVLARGSGNIDDLELYFDGTTLVIYHNRGNGGTATYKTQATTTAAATWAHFVVTYNGSNSWSVYQDGALLGSGASVGGGVPPSNTSKPWQLGLTAASTFTPNNAFPGRIADVKIYTKELSADEVTYLYNNGASGTNPTTTNLIANWKLNEGEGTTVYDSSTTGANGTATNITPLSFWSVDEAVGLIYGKPSSWSDMTLGHASLTGVYDNSTWSNTTGTYFNVVTPSAGNGDVSYGRTGASDVDRKQLAICDVNGDGYKDIVIPGVKIDATISPQRMYVVLGQSGSWTPTSGGLIDVSSHSKSKQLTFPTLAAGAAPTNDIKAIACKDVNNDGKDDVLFYLRSN